MKNQKQRRFVLGDLHGRYDYMMDVLKQSGFDYKKDLLIQIGDIVDRGPDPFLCCKELLKIKNLILIKGNHDAAWLQYLEERVDFLGDSNGTAPTHEAWNKLSDQDQITCKELIFKKQRLYYISDDNIMFVHGGFPRDEKLDDVTDHVFYWDRELVGEAMECKPGEVLETIYGFKEIFIGHTPTVYWGVTYPIMKGGVINVDTGSGKGGPLTIMNVDTKEFWQSNLTEKDSTKLKSYGIPEKSQSTETENVEEAKS